MTYTSRVDSAPRPASIRRLLTDLPIPWKLTLIIGLFSVVVVSLLGVTYAGMSILSGSRAYVGGEGLWSKGEKSAVYNLTRYALFRDPADYQRYLTSIAVPLGDHEVLMEVSKVDMDVDRATQGFLKGHIDLADIPIALFMARRLNGFPYMHQAIAIWGEADADLQQLHAVADRLHAEITSGHPNPARVRTWLNELQSIDAHLTPLEDDFSYTLGAGARWLKRVLIQAMMVGTGLALAIALLLAFWISRHMVSEIEHLRGGAARIAAGDYEVGLHLDGKDEIGDLSRSLHAMAMQRREAERLKDEFFANVSHELRTPLTLILSPLESLLADERQNWDAGARTALQTMHNNAVRLLQLVNGLLDFAKLGAGKTRANREPLPIVEWSQTILNDFQPLMRGKHIQATLKADPSDAVVLMDRYLYERILFNLLSNAVKFTPPEGRIEIRLHCTQDQLTLSVADTGIGIPAQELQNVFQRFRQVEGSSTRRFEGTGLGLALVKEFAGLLDGDMTVESAIGRGSTFTLHCPAPRVSPLSLPLMQASARAILRAQVYPPQAQVPAAAPSSEGALPRVIVAEDNVEMAAHIAGLLAPFCETKIARDGNEALQLIASWPPDLLLCDVMMPERDGLSVCREVKANPETSDIPVVMLTALTHREALLEGWKAGANEYLYKPFHPKELTTRVQSMLDARQSRKRAEERITTLNERLRDHAVGLIAVNKELEAFSYSVSHDLRAPLRAIDGFSREILVNCGEQLDESGKADLHRIRAATQRMSQLIDDLLEFSRIGHAPIAREAVDLSALAEEIAKKIAAEDPHRKTSWTLMPGLTAQGDPRLLHIVLDNLLRNAWKFTRERSNAAIAFEASELDGKRVFTVRDNGIGFDMTYAGKLFKPFQRLHDTHDFPGTGIGLALIQRIIQRHGGKIWAQAKENEGATFFFTIS